MSEPNAGIELQEPIAEPYSEFCSTDPIPCAPSPDNIPRNAWGLFESMELWTTIDRNAGWLQDEDRQSSVILATLFPDVDWAGMSWGKALRVLNSALWHKGYQPSSRNDADTFWSFPATRLSQTTISQNAERTL